MMPCSSIAVTQQSIHENSGIGDGLDPLLATRMVGNQILLCINVAAVDLLKNLYKPLRGEAGGFH